MYAIAAVVIAAIGAAIAGYSAYSSGQAEKQANEYNALVAQNQAEWAEYNAKKKADTDRNMAAYAEMNAALAREDAARAASRKEEETKRLLGAQIARYGKAGVQLSGTPLDVMAQTLADADADRLDLLEQGEREAWDWEMQAWQYENAAETAITTGANQSSVMASQAAFNRARGAAAGTSSLLNTGGTIATGASNVLSTYDKYYNV